MTLDLRVVSTSSMRGVQCIYMRTHIRTEKMEPKMPPILRSFSERESKSTAKLGYSVEGMYTERSKSKITVTSLVPSSKRYFKYLTKKYLKKHNLRDWLYIAAKSREL